MQPLNAARLFSAALSYQDEALPGEAQELVRHLDSSLRSAEDLITDLLDISRLENGRITPDRHPFALSSLFDTLSAEFGVLAADTRFREVLARAYAALGDATQTQVARALAADAHG